MSIDLHVSTWAKDSHSLYDYQARPQHCKQEHISIQNSCLIYKNLETQGTQIGYKCNFSNNTHLFVGNLEFKEKNGCFAAFFKPHSCQNNPNTAYIIIRDQEIPIQALGVPHQVIPYRFPLNSGHTIKLGRVQYMVIEMRNNEETISIRDTQHFKMLHAVYKVPVDNQKNTEHMTCKVCLCEAGQVTNPLISPCNCKGSCQLIHVECLRAWISTKIKKEFHNMATSYNLSRFQCELCKQPFPTIVELHGEKLEMITINKPDKPYIMLESICKKGESWDNKEVHLISAEEGKPLKFGRGHQCHIRVSDISVSRQHAQIELIGSTFYLKDLKSKFGTLVKIEEDLQISEDRPLRIQMGRSKYEFYVSGCQDSITESIDED